MGRDVVEIKNVSQKPSYFILRQSGGLRAFIASTKRRRFPKRFAFGSFADRVRFSPVGHRPGWDVSRSRTNTRFCTRVACGCSGRRRKTRSKKETLSGGACAVGVPVVTLCAFYRPDVYHRAAEGETSRGVRARSPPGCRLRGRARTRTPRPCTRCLLLVCPTIIIARTTTTGILHGTRYTHADVSVRPSVEPRGGTRCFFRSRKLPDAPFKRFTETTNNTSLRDAHVPVNCVLCPSAACFFIYFFCAARGDSVRARAGQTGRSTETCSEENASNYRGM